MTKLVAIAGALLIAACTTPEMIMSQAQRECMAFGYQPGTQEFGLCSQVQYNSGMERRHEAAMNASRNGAIIASQAVPQTIYIH